MTLKGFLKQIQEIASEAGEEYCRVSAQLYSNGTVQYISYINNYGITEAKTVEQCVKDTMDKVFPETKVIQDITI